MNNPFGQLGELKKMRDQALMIQRQLAAEEIEVDKYGIKAIKKSKEVAAKKLQSMSGGMGGLGGLLGGK